MANLVAIIFYAVLAGALIWGVHAMIVRRREKKEKPAADAYSTLGGDGGPHFGRGHGDGADGGGGGGDGGGGGGGD